MQHLSRRFSGYVYLYISVTSFILMTLYALTTLDPLRFQWFTYAVYYFTSVFIVFLPPLIVIAVRRHPMAQVLRINPFPAKYAWFSVGIGVCLYLFNRLFNALLGALLAFTPDQSYTLFGSVSPALWPYVLTACLLPAFFVTATFQGIVQSGLHDVRPVKACLAVGLLYGLFNIGYNAAVGALPLSIFTYAAYGIALSYIALQSGSILPSMIAAFIYTLFGYADIKDILYKYCLSPLGFSPLAAALVLLILAAGIGVLLLFKMPRTNSVYKPLRLPSLKGFRQRLTQPYIPAPKEKTPEAPPTEAPEFIASETIPRQDPDKDAGDTAKNRNVGFIVGGALMAALSVASLVYSIIMIVNTVPWND